jgi:hypothetical protein
MRKCVKSLIENGLHKSAMPTWKINPICDNPSKTHKWWQYFACRGNVGELNFIHSSEKADQRRFIYRGFILTCVQGIAEVEALIRQDESFKDLPACSGHVLMWSLLGALDEALQCSDEERILRLYEASWSATLRIRRAPTPAHFVLDKMSFSKSLRVQIIGVASHIAEHFIFVHTIFFDFAFISPSLQRSHQAILD